MKLDFHTHHYPLAYLDEIERHPTAACSVTRDATGRRLVNYAGDFNIVADAVWPPCPCKTRRRRQTNWSGR
ncbi:MAG: hypothetical protein HY259_04705 [Chloroflexi bacterium]|nr:hypothetical protein [Chloroflexota bacterium]